MRPLALATAALFVGGASAVLGASCAAGSGDVPIEPPSDGGDGGLLTDGDDDGGIDEDAACEAIAKAATHAPLNLYIMFDKSSSMSGDKWDSAKAGLGAFLNDPAAAAAGIDVALKFFPRMPDATPECDQFAYKPPDVDFGPLPQNAAPIMAAMDAQTPSGFSTPIYPALGGGILKGIEIVQNNPGEVAAVLLVTDGQPEMTATMCAGVDPEDPVEIAKLAETGANFNPPVSTFVIGLPGVNQAFANQVAAAGGTEEAILIGATNVQQEFQDALGKVIGEALPCEYDIPDEVLNDTTQIAFVNIEITPSNGDPEIVPQNQGCKGDGEGWQYEGAGPDSIVLCPATCAALKKDFEAEIKILLGCSTIIK